MYQPEFASLVESQMAAPVGFIFYFYLFIIFNLTLKKSDLIKIKHC